MRIVILTLAVLISITLIGHRAPAVAPGKTIEYEGGGAGKVILDGKIHMGKGLTCTDCHPKIFQMRKGTAKITKAEMDAGKFCSECHNGTKAFKGNDPANCARCHKK